VEAGHSGSGIVSVIGIVIGIVIVIGNIRATLGIG
jgi:hypothetical protein